MGVQVLELFKASDKYDVAGLVKECVQIFRGITDASTVAALLQVGFDLCFKFFVVLQVADHPNDPCQLAA